MNQAKTISFADDDSLPTKAEFTYDERGLPDLVTHGGVVLADLDRLLAGNVHQRKSNDGGQQTACTYDQLGRVLSMDVQANLNSVWTNKPTRD